MKSAITPTSQIDDKPHRVEKRCPRFPSQEGARLAGSCVNERGVSGRDTLLPSTQFVSCLLPGEPDLAWEVVILQDQLKASTYRKPSVFPTRP